MPTKAKIKKVFIRYNPSKSAPGRPWQFRTGRLGRAQRKRTSGLNPVMRRNLKEFQGQWFEGGFVRR